MSCKACNGTGATEAYLDCPECFGSGKGEEPKGVHCDKCGGEVRVGDWPFCKGDPKEHSKSWKFGFDPFEPYIDPNIDAYGQDVGYNRHLGRMLRGTLVTSREHRRALMKKNNLDWAGRRDEGREI